MHDFNVRLLTFFAFVFVFILIGKLIHLVYRKLRPLPAIDYPLSQFITPEDEVVRTDWLQSLYILVIGTPLWGLIGYIILRQLVDHDALYSYTKDTLTSCMRLFISCSLLYYFAYTKSGTKWLGFSIVVTGLVFFFMALALVIVTYDPSDPEFADLWELSYLMQLPPLLLTLYSWYQSIPLFKTNRRLKQRKREAETAAAAELLPSSVS